MKRIAIIISLLIAALITMIIHDVIIARDIEEIKSSSRWERVYAYVGDEIKFIKIDTNIGPAYVNVLHIASIRVTNAVSQEGKTEISLINGTEFYSSESIDLIVSRIIEK